MGGRRRAAPAPRAEGPLGPGAVPSVWARRFTWLVAVLVGSVTMAVAARTPGAPVAAQPATTAPAAATSTTASTVDPGTSTTGAATTTAAATTTSVATEPATTTLPATTTAAATSTVPATTTAAPTTTSSSPTTTDARASGAELAEVTLTAVPADVLLPTSEATLDPATNPINGRRSLVRPDGRAAYGCTVDTDAPRACLIGTLDALGFDVGGLDEAVRARRLRQAVAAVQLDAGRRVTGVADRALFEYLGVWPGSEELGADEVRRIGTSAGGRPLVARRYGNGPRVVLVVGQTHGDEEAGLRVVLRLATAEAPAGVTLWVVPTMNPDGLARDTRYLANGRDPNRASPTEPEQLAVQQLAEAVRPVLAVFYHQNYGWIGGSGASKDAAARYHALTGLGDLYTSGDCALGFVWCPIDDAVGSSSILVELPDVVTPGAVRAHAAAMLAVAAG